MYSFCEIGKDNEAICVVYTPIFEKNIDLSIFTHFCNLKMFDKAHN